jgi:hypothetical protein
VVKNTAATVNDSHVVYLDPDYGLHIPRAENVAERGVVTNSQHQVRAGETIPASDELRASGVVLDTK